MVQILYDGNRNDKKNYNMSLAMVLLMVQIIDHADENHAGLCWLVGLSIVKSLAG